MQAFSDAINSLVESGSWFARAAEIRLWVVRVSSELRKAALQMLAALEFHNDNRSAWVILEDAHTSSDPGWRARGNRLLAHWEDRRKAFREQEAIEMPEARIYDFGTGPPTFLRDVSTAEPLRQACAAVVGAIRPPLEGFVIVLAPTILNDVEHMGEELEGLLRDPGLQLCRWVWVLDAAQSWPGILDHLGDLSMCVECIPDPTQKNNDLDAIISAPGGIIGRAGPRGVTPPKRVDDPPAQTPEAREAMLREHGINPQYLEKAPHLQRLILGAAIALKDGKGIDAVRMQREAGDLAESLGNFQVAVLCRIALSSYLSGLALCDDALAELRGATKLAHQHGLGLQEAQAHLAVGLLLALRKRFRESAGAYTECAQCAEGAKIPVLAIEAWRMAGQVNLQAGEEIHAATCFRHAIRVAEGSEAKTVKDSTASEVARKLADLCAKCELTVQSASLYEQADAMERGEIGLESAPTVEA